MRLEPSCDIALGCLQKELQLNCNVEWEKLKERSVQLDKDGEKVAEEEMMLDFGDMGVQGNGTDIEVEAEAEVEVQKANVTITYV